MEAATDTTASRRPRRSSSAETVLTGYRVGHTIGTGSFGKVKLAVEELTHTAVAIKEIRKARLPRDQGGQRERRILGLLRHPNIAQLRAEFETEDKLYLVMDYCSGGELFDYIVLHHRLSENCARRFFRQMVSAIGYCHSYGICHRDLKPENMLLDEAGNIKIVDFGFTNQFQTGQTLETFCGSVQYASPEMVDGLQYEGPEVDCWSLGVILYAMVTGTLPFDRENQAVMFDAIALGEYAMPDYVSGPCANAIRSLLTVDPARRATMVDMARHQWVTDGAPLDFCIPARVATTEPREAVLAKMTLRGFSVSETLREDLATGKVTKETSVYHLLLAQEAKDVTRAVRRIADRAPLGRVKARRIMSSPEVDLAVATSTTTTTPATTPNTSDPILPNVVAATKARPPLPSLDASTGTRPSPSRRAMGSPTLFSPFNATPEMSETSAHTATSSSRASPDAASPLRAPSPAPRESARLSMSHANLSTEVSARLSVKLPPITTPSPSTRRRSMDVGAAVAAAAAATAPTTGLAVNTLPAVRGPVCPQTTTSKTPEQVLDEVRRTATALSWVVESSRNESVDCTVLYGDAWVSITAEVCRIAGLDSVYTLRLRRREGDTWAYKVLCNTFLSEIKL